ncbi:MAG: RnfABCDGE type electron transport complex subunit B [Burkholderiaceae bacterium]
MRASPRAASTAGFAGRRMLTGAWPRRGADQPLPRPAVRAGIDALATLLGRPPLPLDPACGVEAAFRVAVVDEEHCIGCTKCIVACPVDAIIGATRRMHTVVSELCSGCDLCVPACPVDCIAMAPSAAHPAWSADDARMARQRHARRAERLVRERDEHARQVQHKARRKLEVLAAEPQDEHTARKRAAIEAAVRRARERLGRPAGSGA